MTAFREGDWMKFEDFYFLFYLLSILLVLNRCLKFISENVCPEPVDPINGHVNCTSNVDSLHCTLICEEGYAFAVQPRDYFCTYDIDGSVLAPDSTIDPFPDCSCK
jgi:hypothetical protein